MIKKQRETEKASLKGGIKTILNSMRGAMVFLNKAAPSSAFIWSQQITFLRCLPPTWGREGSSRLPGWILAARASVNKGNKLQLHLPQGLKGSLHIKHSSSLIWKGAIRLALGRGRERSLSRVGTIVQREEKTAKSSSPSACCVRAATACYRWLFPTQEVRRTTKELDRTQTHIY